MQVTVLCVFAVPPNIIDEETSGDILVRDGDSVSLVCTARGYPEPKIKWRREDNEKIMLRQGRGNKSKGEYEREQGEQCNKDRKHLQLATAILTAW